VRERRLQAIATMIAAVAVFSFMDGLLKLLSAHYPPMQVAALRGATSLPFTLLPVLLRGRLGDLRPRRWPMHLLRGMLSVLVLGGFIYAVRVLSLANAYAVFLSAPLIVAALSVPLLRERIDWRNWLAILVGLGGVLTMLRPSASGLSTLGTLAALVGAFAYALSAITVRVLTRSDTTVSVVFWTVSPLPAGCRSSTRTGNGSSAWVCWRRSRSTCSPRRFAPRLPRLSHPSSTRRCCGESPSTAPCGTCSPRRGCVSEGAS